MISFVEMTDLITKNIARTEAAAQTPTMHPTPPGALSPTAVLRMVKYSYWILDHHANQWYNPPKEGPHCEVCKTKCPCDNLIKLADMWGVVTE